MNTSKPVIRQISKYQLVVEFKGNRAYFPTRMREEAYTFAAKLHCPLILKNMRDGARRWSALCTTQATSKGYYYTSLSGGINRHHVAMIPQDSYKSII
jgi:hypothetical protein